MKLSFGRRVAYAFRCFFALLFAGRFPGDVVEFLTSAPAPQPGAAAVPAATTAPAPSPAVPAPAAAPAVEEDRGDRAVQLLALLQRDGRLLDFLREDLGGYSDAQIGTAVRDVHARCRGTLERYLEVEPVLLEDEGQAYALSAALDPAKIKVVGNVPAGGTARGVVRHRGWRVTRLALPPLAPPSARHIVVPAEVEVA